MLCGSKRNCRFVPASACASGVASAVGSKGRSCDNPSARLSNTAGTRNVGVAVAGFAAAVVAVVAGKGVCRWPAVSPVRLVVLRVA